MTDVDKYRLVTLTQKHLANPCRQRLLGRRLAARINALAVRSLGTDLLTVRIDLDP